MRTRNLNASCLFLGIMLLSACSAAESQTTTPSSQIQPTSNTEQIPEQQMLSERAVLYSADFEAGFPPELHDWPTDWQVVSEEDGNSIFCNQATNEWTNFLFGLDEWENYALSLRLKFLTANQGQGAEVYFRVNSAIDGYRAAIYDNRQASIGYYPPSSHLGGGPAAIRQGQWFPILLHIVGDEIQFFLDGDLVVGINDGQRTNGKAGIGVTPNTGVCLDDILVLGLDEEGNPLEDPKGLVFGPFNGTAYSIQEKIDNRPTIPVFYPWSSDCGEISEFDFDCDTPDTPYSLVWISQGVPNEIDSTIPRVSASQSMRMRADENTLYLISDEWLYWYPGARILPTQSPFYLDEVFKPHVGTEFDPTMVINFIHPDWPDIMAEKAFNYQQAGFDGMMLDWWNNRAGNGRSDEIVEAARLAIVKAIREKAGDDFIIMANVNWGVDDPSAQYLSGVFLELWKPSPSVGYDLATSGESYSSQLKPSIENMEKLLLYWNDSLQQPKVIAFEPWKITKSDYIADRTSEENIKYAMLYTAMGVVIPENGYILYADDGDDWEGGDHQHAYYDFYHMDFGQATSGMVQYSDGVAYKLFESGLIAYNRTESEQVVTLPSGTQFTIGPLQGLFLEGVSK